MEELGPNKICNGSISRFMYPQQEASLVCVCIRPDLLQDLGAWVGAMMMDAYECPQPSSSSEPSFCPATYVLPPYGNELHI